MRSAVWCVHHTVTSLRASEWNVVVVIVVVVVGGGGGGALAQHMHDRRDSCGWRVVIISAGLAGSTTCGIAVVDGTSYIPLAVHYLIGDDLRVCLLGCLPFQTCAPHLLANTYAVVVAQELFTCIATMSHQF